MDSYEATIRKRDRRTFLDRPLREETTRRILQAGRMAGSSKNAQPNRFILVRDRERLQALAAISPNGRWLASAAAAVIIVQEGREHGFDAGRAAQNMMVAAFGEGVGSCPAHLPETELAREFGIPGDLHVDRVIGFGYVDPAQGGPPSGVARKRLPLAEIVHEERW
ncbi:MAG: nitroreductase family protein [Dehalococcoidia bacterium]|nr:nitroreductase family protein [Dehalococcoidia bacterium]